MLYRKDKKRFVHLRHILGVPFILLPLIPMVIFDIALEIYHQVSFRLYGIDLVKRKNYIVFDRGWLSYLNLTEKLYCIYCSYANGFLAYAVEIAGRTEEYWCGIKHKLFPGYVQPWHHKNFAEYGDREDFLRKYVN